MEIWIIEDELPAARRMAKLLEQADATIRITATYATVADTVAALQLHQPDLMVMDIHLADGISFHVFRQAQVQCPVIFTTAYDEYAIEAFKLNSVDYLLKPVKEEELSAALDKYKRIHARPATLPIEQLMQSLGKPAKSYKQRFVVRYGEHLKTVETTAAAYFYTENKATFLVTRDNKRYIVDYPMDQLEGLLDPKRFFRINRQFIIAVDAIAEMLTWTKARVLVKLEPPTKLDTIVSSERAAAFKQWLDDALP
ncbi:MAG: LytTR family DNA-binding domain-containing protein [Chitinophagaceae bacterium]|jgi:DNA-binding LytR/AlgR family response regulator|nr:LytTR family DNA-binding domain-containing protein [Chitinophagaceae bacterium]